MKKALKFLLVGFVASAMIFGFASCSDDEEDEKAATTTTTENNGENGDSTTTTTENNGTTGSTTTTTTESTNPFSGKTWRVTEEGFLVEYAFSNETVTNTIEESQGNHPYKIVVTAKYTYDTAKSLLSLEPTHMYQKEGDEEAEYSNISEIEAAFEALGFTGADLACKVASYNAEFRTKVVYKYEITGNTLKLTNYFDGVLPTSIEFNKDGGESDSDIEFRTGEIKVCGTHARYYIYPTFTDGNFSGTVFKKIYENDNEVFTNLGNAAGTYSTSGTGSEGCTITLKFTALPDDAATAISLNTDYVLDQEPEDSDEYTLVE